MSGKISKTKHNVVKNIVKALEEKQMKEAVEIVRAIYPVGGDSSLQDKPNPLSRTQLRKRYWKEVITPQLKKEKINNYISFRKIMRRVMSEKVKDFIKRVDEILGS